LSLAMPTYTTSPYPDDGTVAKLHGTDVAQPTGQPGPSHSQKAERGSPRPRRRENRRAAAFLQLSGFLDDLVGFDDVVGLHFVPARDHHAALVAVLDLADVVLEPAQAADLALVDLHRVADDPEVGFAGDLAL